MSQKVLWQKSDKYIPYPDSQRDMEAYVEAMLKGDAPERVWLLEHSSAYTLGTSAKAEDVLNPGDIPVYETGRGGQVTYHGPGQRVVYVQLNLKERAPDLRQFVYDLESWIIESLKQLGVCGERRLGRVGIWVETSQGECKIAAIGVRVRKWITQYGFSLNVNANLDPFRGIVPCGIQGYGVTSLQELGVQASMKDVDQVLQRCFSRVF